MVRVIADPDYTRGEYAILVRSDLKGRGLGWQLMQHLIAYAKAEQLQELHGSVLAGNTTMLQMCRQLGFAIESEPGDPTIRRVVLDLPSCERGATQADALQDASHSLSVLCAAAAPLLCAGLIGFRALRMAGNAVRLGIYGFGAAAHIVAQVAQFEGRSVYAFTRAGDTTAQAFARRLGCVWAGSSEEQPPTELDAAIIFAPVGSLLPAALACVRKGGVVVLGGIHMSDIPSMPYARLWGERVVRSVANLTRQDAKDFLELAARTPIQTHIEQFALGDANKALDRLRAGQLTGAAVLIP